jgi:3-keto-disaccharide hydrolase
MARSARVSRRFAVAAAALALASADAQAIDRGPPSFFEQFLRSLAGPVTETTPARHRHDRHHRSAGRRQPAARAHVERNAIPAATRIVTTPAQENVARVLVLSPKAAASSEATHSALVVTRKRYHGNLSFAGRVQTVRQLRTGSAPNPWECAWVVWNFQDAEHFYYLAIKPTGWELGKRDPAYPGGQRFLASGHSDYPLGVWHRFAVTQEGGRITVDVNGTKVASYHDDERSYTSGALGFYAEDAEVQIADITAPFAENFAAYPPQTIKIDGHVMKSWVVPFIGYGFVAIDERRK